MQQQIESIYPNARNGDEVTGGCMEVLTAAGGVEPQKTLLATSVCSDEIIRSATSFRDHLQLISPFQLGGLAGYPFAGLTGLKAFISHIPDGGSAILLYGPHIGVSGDGRIGEMKRSGQQKSSSCCGALKSLLETFRNQTDAVADPDLDYQMWKLESELADNRDRFFSHREPLVEVTELTYELIDRRFDRLIGDCGSLLNGFRIARIGGVIINTDHGEPDWFDLRRFDLTREDGSRETLSISG